MDQLNAPLWEALQQHRSHSKGNFHVPGHKAGQVFDHAAYPCFSELLSLDLTEIGQLDDLHAPTGVIYEAQQLAAEVFAADQTRFLVGGTTSGILASILSTCQPGDKILVSRHCHQSVFHGCWLAGATVIPVAYGLDPQSGLELPTSPEVVKYLLELYSDAKAVVLTSPTYFGVVQYIEQLAEIAHCHGIPLIVDEAHGAHFGFHHELPSRALAQGADIAIQSTHKLLPAMTMSSMLHIKEGLVDVANVDRYLKAIQSSSPSYPLMASLDLARRYMATEGKAQLAKTLEQIAVFRQRLQSISALRELHVKAEMDPYKMTLVSEYYTGYELAERLEEAGIYIELADVEKLLFVFSLGTTQTELDYLWTTLYQCHKSGRAQNKPKLMRPPELRAGEPLPYAECRNDQRLLVPLSQAIGQRSADHLMAYPPGMPLILMGETIQQEIVDYLLLLAHSGGSVRGFVQQDDGSYHVYIFKS
jgi:arginine/lysine/ornithine decarboxylase